MTNPYDPAFPVELDQRDVRNPHGLTKREYFSALAMQGLLSNDGLLMFHAKEFPDKKLKEIIAEQSVIAADALITELNKEPTK